MIKYWDDLRFFLSVAEHGSTLAASASLRTSQSTVFRRISSLETDLSVELFERRASGYALTAAGIDLLPLAQRARQVIDDIDRLAARKTREKNGVIKLSVPDGALEYLLSPVMEAFRKKRPEVRLEIIATPKQLDLAIGEADVALRSNPASDPDLYGRRLVQERPMLVASKQYAERCPLPRNDGEVGTHTFIGTSGFLGKVLATWEAENVLLDRIIIRPDGIPSTLTAIRSGLGLGILPKFIVDREPMLIASELVLPLKPFELWIVTHKRLRNTNAVKDLMDTVAAYVLATTPK